MPNSNTDPVAAALTATAQAIGAAATILADPELEDLSDAATDFIIASQTFLTDLRSA